MWTLLIKRSHQHIGQGNFANWDVILMMKQSAEKAASTSKVFQHHLTDTRFV